MGIYDREYYRDDVRRGGGFGGGYAPVCKWIVGVTAAVYLLQLLTRPGFPMGGVDVVSRWLMLDSNLVFNHLQIWRLFTVALVHDVNDPWHIIFNMLFLWWFGSELEAVRGSKEFLWFYLASVLVASMVAIFINILIGIPTRAVGASGGVMSVIMVYAMIYPRRKILLFFIIPVEIRWLALGYFLFSLAPVLRALGSGMPDMSRVGHGAHLGGLVFGFFYHRQQWTVSSWVPSFRSMYASSGREGRERRRTGSGEGPATIPFPSKTQSHDHHESHVDEDLQQRVDSILEKISREGQDSLSDEEKRILSDASRKYREDRQ